MTSKFLAPLRVLAQKFYPGALADNKINDCWVLAALMGVNHVAPWLWLVNIVQFRKAAAKEGAGSVVDAARGVKALYPQLKTTVVTTWSWAKCSAFFKAGHGGYLSVKSSALPAKLQFGYADDHAIYAYWRNGTFNVDNPLAAPHSGSVPITEAALKKAAEAHSQAKDGINVLFFPTTDEAFATHPLLKGVVDAAVAAAQPAQPPAPSSPTTDELDAARLAGAQAEWDRQHAGATVALLSRPVA